MSSRSPPLAPRSPVDLGLRTQTATTPHRYRAAATGHRALRRPQLTTQLEHQRTARSLSSGEYHRRRLALHSILIALILIQRSRASTDPRAVPRYGDDRLDQACERAVDAECRDHKIVIAMIERALEADTAAADPVPDNVIVGRFARDPGHFASSRGVTR